MADADDIAQLEQMVGGIADRLGDVSVGLTGLATALHNLNLPTNPVPTLVVSASAAVAGDNSVKVSWTTLGDTSPVTEWTVGRNGSDLNGSGPWSTDAPSFTTNWQFNSLKPGTAYTFTVTPFAGSTALQGTQVTFTIPAPADGGTGGGEGAEGVTAAARYTWGKPDAVSDEFDYEGKPDPKKWQYSGAYGVGWDGHVGNGRRMPENCFVKDGILTLRGDTNGNTGWLRQNKVVKYGRWEIRSRSRNTSSSGGLYHPLHLIWPNPEKWPANGEYDFLEYTDPDAKAAGAWLHYPHPNMPVQQIGQTKNGVDMTQWHNFAFEWTADHLKGWIDGAEWYTVSGGRNSTRSDIQAMPGGSLTHQLDNFTGDGGLRAAVFEIAWSRFYPV